MFTNTDSLIYEIKTEDIFEDFSKDKEIFDSGNYSAKSKYYDDSNKLVVANMKDEKARVAIKDSIGLKLKMHFILVDDSSENKKTRDMNKNVAAQ